MEVEKKTLKMCAGLCSADFKAEADTDIIVPDTKPDVLKIISAVSYPVIKEKYAQKGKVTLSGIVYYKIIYEGENDDTVAHLIEYTAPFSHQHEISCIDENTQFYAYTTPFTTKPVIVNSRKISVHSVFDVKVSAVCDSEKSIVTSAGGDMEIPYLSKPLNITNKVISTSGDIELGESVELPGTASEILFTSASVRKKDVKVVNNKVVIKGELNVKIIYLSENNAIESFSYDTEFSDVLDIPGINPEMMTNTALYVKEYNVKLTESAENRSTAMITAVISAYIDAYESAEEIGIYDAYSPDYNIKTTYENIGYLTLVSDEIKQSSVSDFIETPGNIEDVLDDSATVSVKSQSYGEDGEITVEAVVTASVIDVENGRVNSVTKEIPVTFKFDAPKGLFDVQIVPYISVSQISYSQKGANQIEVKVPVMCEVMLFSKNTERLVADIDTENAEKIDKTDMPSLTVYFVKDGDTLWNIAKKYSTSVEEIARVNNIENPDELSIGTKLLIPKKR